MSVSWDSYYLTALIILPNKRCPKHTNEQRRFKQRKSTLTQSYDVLSTPTRDFFYQSKNKRADTGAHSKPCNPSHWEVKLWEYPARKQESLGRSFVTDSLFALTYGPHPCSQVWCKSSEIGFFHSIFYTIEINLSW